MKHFVQLVALTGTCVLLSTCGGGGGGGGGNGNERIEAKPSPVITADNAAQIGVEVLEVTNDAVNLGFNTDDMFAHFGFEYPQSSASSGLIGAANAGAPVIATGAQTINCFSGGSYTLEVNDADGNKQLSKGDVFSFRFDNCQDPDILTKGATLNGTFSVTLELVTAASPYEVPAIEKFDYKDFSMQDINATGSEGERVTVNGDMTADFETANSSDDLFTTRFQGNALTGITVGSADDSGTVTLTNYAVTEDEDENLKEDRYVAKGTLDSTLIGGQVTFDTPQALKWQFDAAYPYAGQELIKGKNQSALLIDVVDKATVRLSVDADGDGSYEITLDKTWQQLADENGLDIE